MWRTGLLALLSHWRRHPGQAATLVLGLALATGLWTGVQAINAEARAGYDRAAAVLDQSGLPILVPREGDALPLADYVALRRAGWRVSPVLEGTARLGEARVTLLGLDPLTAPSLPQADPAPLARGGGEAPANDPGAGLARFVTPPGELFGTADTIAALGPLPPDAPALRVSRDLGPGTLLGDIGTVARLLDAPDSLSRLILLREPPAGAPPLGAIAPGLARTAPDSGAEIDGLTGSFHLNLTAFGLLSFAVGLFIVHGAIGLAFEQRRGLFRTLRAVGLPARALTLLLAGELTLVALVSGLLGVALGYVIAAALLPDVAATLRGLYGAPASGTLQLRPGWVLAGLGIAFLGTAAAAAQSLWRLWRLPVLAAARPRAWAMASGAGLRRQGIAAAALLAAALALALFGQGLVAGFATLGALLIGAALALPPLLAAALALAAGRARGPLAQWFWADTRQQLPGLSLALMALLLALAANIGVSTMVGSFRGTFTGWLDQRLSAEVYLNAGSAEAAAALRPFLEDRADAVLPAAQTEARLNGIPGSILALPDAATYRADWPLLEALPEVWPDLAAGAGALVNEQLATRQSLAPGDTLDIDGHATRILGTYSDYGNPRGQAVLGLGPFSQLYPEVPVQRFALRLPPGDVPALIADLRRDHGLREDQVTDQGSLKALSLSIFERTFAVTAALNVLTLGVAGLAILTSLLTLATLRLPQVAPVWALGLTRARLAWLELARSAILALMTALLALPVGLALAWVLLAVVNVQAFGWRLPMQVFPGDWARLAVLALVAALAAAAWPARRLATRPPADLLKVFASER